MCSSTQVLCPPRDLQRMLPSLPLVLAFAIHRLDARFVVRARKPSGVTQIQERKKYELLGLGLQRVSEGWRSQVSAGLSSLQLSSLLAVLAAAGLAEGVK